MVLVNTPKLFVCRFCYCCPVWTKIRIKKRINYQSKHNLYSLPQALATCFVLNQSIFIPLYKTQSRYNVITYQHMVLLLVFFLSFCGIPPIDLGSHKKHNKGTLLVYSTNFTSTIWILHTFSVLQHVPAHHMCHHHHHHHHHVFIVVIMIISNGPWYTWINSQWYTCTHSKIQFKHLHI